MLYGFGVFMGLAIFTVLCAEFRMIIKSGDDPNAIKMLLTALVFGVIAIAFSLGG
jgi:hypothetical protein